VKTVFNNDQLAHVFIAQSQPEGRNPGSSMYFHGEKIYSYGSHYLLAQIYKAKGKRVVLLNSDRYSNATAKHRSAVSRAARDNLKLYSVSDPSNPRASAKDWQAELGEEYFKEFSAIKPSRYSSAKSFEGSVQEYNDFCDLFDLKTLKIKFTALHRTLLEEKYQLLKYRESLRNTPEALAKKEAEREKREEREARLRVAKQSEAIQIWKNGGSLRSDIQSLRPQLIRVKGSSVETSGGASVPLDQALTLLSKVKRGVVKEGERIGHFTFNSIENGCVRIGCHTIDINEAETVLNEFKNKGLKVLKGGAQ
jgi:hypothetical protein